MPATVRAKEIEGLRELHKPTTFDAWVCLGGDYRDQAEVQERATLGEAQELSLAYTAFREKLEYNAMVEKADEAQSRQWFRSEPEQSQECYWCDCF
jgi:hypothetical protein